MTSTTGSARQIASDVTSGTRSAVEVLDAHLAYVDELEGDISAFNHLLVDEARARAAAIDAKVAAGEPVGSMAGVPVALKDNMCTRGVPTTCSSKILEGWRPPYDATVVQRLVAADAMIIGKTNLDEFAMGSSTEHSAFGPTRNPLDVSRVPGGSSGGSAAAVAANMAAVSLGSDTGGSIRQPASYCGLVGMKPTFGAVSRYGLVAFGSSLDQIGPFAHTVADAALTFETIAGYDPLDSTSIDAAVPDLSAALEGDVSGLRIGIISDFMVDAVDADVQARVRAAAEGLEKAGATIVEVSIPAATHGLAAYYIVAPAEASSNLARFDGVRYGLRVDGANVAAMNTATRTAGFGDEVKRRIMLGTYALSAGYYDAYYGKAQQVRTLLSNEFAAAYESCDAMLAPTAPTTAFAFGDKTEDPMAMYASDLCTIPSNLVGHPAMSVPYGVGDDGMPIGVQVLAPAQSEALMFQVGAGLERTLA